MEELDFPLQEDSEDLRRLRDTFAKHILNSDEGIPASSYLYQASFIDGAFPPYEVLSPNPAVGNMSDAEAERDRSSVLNGYAKDGHALYDLYQVMRITYDVSQALKLRQEEATSNIDENPIECRLQQCYSFLGRNYKNSEAVDYLKKGLGASLACFFSKIPLRNVKIVSFDESLYFGGGLIIDVDKNLWPQEKALARVIDYPFVARGSKLSDWDSLRRERQLPSAESDIGWKMAVREVFSGMSPEDFAGVDISSYVQAYIYEQIFALINRNSEPDASEDFLSSITKIEDENRDTTVETFLMNTLHPFLLAELVEGNGFRSGRTKQFWEISSKARQFSAPFIKGEMVFSGFRPKSGQFSFGDVKSISDVISSFCVILDNAINEERELVESFEELRHDVFTYLSIVLRVDFQVFIPVLDIFILFLRGDYEVYTKLKTTIAEIFFTCNVFDTLRSGCDLSDALERAGSYSRAIYILRKRNIVSATSELLVYELFNDEEVAKRVQSHLTSLLTRDEYCVLKAEAEGRVHTATTRSLFEYQLLRKSECSDSDIVEPGVGHLLRSNGHMAEHGIMEGSGWRLTMSAVVYKKKLRVERYEQLCRRVKRHLREHSASQPSSWSWSMTEPLRNLSFMTTAEFVINSFVSGACGAEASTWMVHRLIKGDVHVSSESTCSLAKFLTFSPNSDAPKLSCQVCSEVMWQFPVLFDTRTKRAFLKLDREVPAKRIVLREDHYEMEDTDMPVGDYKKGVLRRKLFLQ